MEMSGKWFRMRLIAGFLIAFAAGNGIALQRSDLLFYSSLDGKVVADWARGKSAARDGYVPEFVPGVRGQAAAVNGKNSQAKTLKAPVSFWLDIDLPVDYTDKDIGPLRYSQPDNLHWQEGTLSFWVKALDWQSGGGGNHYLAHLDTAETISFVWAPYPGWIEYRQSRIDDRDTYKKFIAYPGIPRETWRNITVAWRGKEQRIYVDGLKKAHATEGVPGYTGPGDWFAFGAADRSTSAFDEVVVLAQAANETEAKALYYRSQRPGDSSLIAIPQTAAAIKLDGKVEEHEYDGALKLAGWTDAILGVANDDLTSAYVTYDKDNLYVAFVFPVPDKYRVDPVVYVNQPIKMKAKEADRGEVFLDDYFEIVLSPPGAADVYRLALNGAATRFDAKNGDASWNGSWKFQTYFDDYFWKVELALPFAMFGRPAPATGETWGINLKHHAAQVIEMDSVWCYSGREPSPMGSLVFSGDAPAVRLEKVVNPAHGRIDIEASINPGAAKVSGDWQLETLVSTTCYADLNPDGDKSLKELDPVPPEGWEDRQKLSVETGKITTAKVSGNLPRALAADLVISVKDSGGKEVFRHRLPFVFSLQTALEVKMLPSREKLIAEVDCGSLALLESGVTAVIRIRDGKGNAVRTITVDKMAQVKQSIEIDIAGLDTGKYTAVAALAAGARHLPDMEKEFEIQAKPEWLGTKVGVSEEVPAPWTALEVDANAIACWGRKYSYADSVFPAKIDILGQELLAAPMVLTAKEAGKTQIVGNARINVTSRKPHRVEYTLSAAAGSFDFKTENWIEYDGLVWVKLIVTPKVKNAQLEELVIEVPYNKAIATHWFNGQYRPDSPTGYLPREKYVCAPANFARVGDAERGLQWCWEHDYTWQLAESRKAMELVPEADRYLVRLKLVDHAVTLERPLEIEIGLQALPCQPQPKGYHGPYWGGNAGVRSTLKNKEIPLISLWTHKWFLWNYPNLTAEQMEKGRERIARDWRTLKLKGCFYSNHQTTSPMSPEYRYYCEEWRVVPSGIPNFKALDAMDISKAAKDHSAHICYGSETYTDFYLYYLQKALRDFHAGTTKNPIGLYYDNSGAANCANTSHNHGFLANGEVKPIKAILAWRRATERIRRVLKNVDPDAWYSVHMSGNPGMAHWSYNDILIPGEQYAAFFQFKKAQAEAAGKEFPYDYTQMCELDRVRAEYSSLGYGPAQVFLSETWQWIKQASPEQLLRAERHLFGLLFVNDVMSWGNDSAKAPVLDALWEHLGWDDQVVFHPYWRNQSSLHMTPYDENKIVASIFTREGKACIFAFNNTDADVPATFDLKLADLGVAEYENGKLFEPLAGKEYALDGTKAAVTLPKRDFQIFFLIK